MATTTTASPGASRRPRLQPTDSAAKGDTVKWWARIGALFVALTLYQWGSWILGGNLESNPRRGPVPGWQLAFARFEEVLGPVVALLFVYFFIYKPWRSERRVTLDGLLIIVFLQMWALQDPWVDYLRPWSLYSTVWTNIGCPQCHAPGWLSPKTMSEPILFMWGAYLGALLGAIIVANRIMSAAKRRWPHISTIKLVGIAFAFLCLMDFFMESAWLLTGAYTYGGAVRGLSLWAGRYYQFPVYEIVLWGAAWTALACVRFFRNDKGQTVAERGIDELRTSAGRETGLRLLALIGICNVIFLAYNISVNIAGLHADNYPRSILSRAYLTGNMCGAYTETACPGPQVPIPVGPDSARVTPHGTVATPGGLPLQTPVAPGGR